MSTLESFQTFALISVLKIKAGGIILTRIRVTFIDIDLTIDTPESCFALTKVAIDLILTGAIIGAWIWLTLINVDFTNWATETWKIILNTVNGRNIHSNLQ